KVTLEFYIDIHAHSTMMNGFMYGNIFEDEERFQRQAIFPKLLCQNAEDFSFDIMRHFVKGLAEIQVNHIHCIPSISPSQDIVIEFYKLRVEEHSQAADLVPRRECNPVQDKVQFTLSEARSANQQDLRLVWIELQFIGPHPAHYLSQAPVQYSHCLTWIGGKRESSTSFNRDAVKAGTGRRFLGGLLDDTSYCYTLEVSFYSYIVGATASTVPYTEETCIL
ncbi:Cytosolic carboxypeptidase 6, partial [Varanus komodoensis]